MILVIDNYDSFVYNLVQYLGEITNGTLRYKVIRNDELSATQALDLNPSHIIISPGPCTPNEAGISLDLIKLAAGNIPLLGVCLGHQAIGQAFGGTVCRATLPVHGKATPIFHMGRSIFHDLPSPFLATRYHSLIVDNERPPSCLEVIAWSQNNEIMGLAHREHQSVIGIQFHPESIMTPLGKDLLRAFISLS